MSYKPAIPLRSKDARPEKLRFGERGRSKTEWGPIRPHSNLLLPSNNFLSIKKTENLSLQFLLPLHLPQFHPPDLARNRLGQALHKIHLERVLIWRRHMLDMLLQLACQFG